MLTTTVDKAVAWARATRSIPLTFGLACCAIEMMSIVAARVDIARFGFEAFRASPRQADLLILSGRVSIKMAPVVRRIYDQMLEPKWAISMGACCSSMGVFNNYALVPADKFMPIDVHVPGCPPRPEALMHGILRLREKIQGNDREPAGASATTRSAPRSCCPGRTPATRTSTCSSPETPPVPDATGLELIAQELRDADRRVVLDTEFHPRPRASLVADPRRIKPRARAPARQGLQRSWPACTASTTTPRSRASASSTSCST